MNRMLHPNASFSSDGEDADGTDDEEKRERVLTKIKVPSELDGRMKQNLFYFKQVNSWLSLNQSVKNTLKVWAAFQQI